MIKFVLLSLKVGLVVLYGLALVLWLNQGWIGLPFWICWLAGGLLLAHAGEYLGLRRCLQGLTPMPDYLLLQMLLFGILYWQPLLRRSAVQG
ncbi:MAG: hypothetical protein V7629_01815 [Motiliproteus sp.]